MHVRKAGFITISPIDKTDSLEKCWQKSETFQLSIPYRRRVYYLVYYTTKFILESNKMR